MIDDTPVIVEKELERVLPGWKPRRFGKCVYIHSLILPVRQYC